MEAKWNQLRLDLLFTTKAYRLGAKEAGEKGRYYDVFNFLGAIPALVAALAMVPLYRFAKSTPLVGVPAMSLCAAFDIYYFATLNAGDKHNQRWMDQRRQAQKYRSLIWRMETYEKDKHPMKSAMDDIMTDKKQLDANAVAREYPISEERMLEAKRIVLARIAAQKKE